MGVTLACGLAPPAIPRGGRPVRDRSAGGVGGIEFFAKMNGWALRENGWRLLDLCAGGRARDAMRQVAAQGRAAEWQNPKAE